VGFATALLTIVLSFVPSPDEANPVLAMEKVTGGTVALLLIGALLYWLAKKRAAPSS
jgi:uncharacterized membrane protein YccC